MNVLMVYMLFEANWTCPERENWDRGANCQWLPADLCFFACALKPIGQDHGKENEKIPADDFDWSFQSAVVAAGIIRSLTPGIREFRGEGALSYLTTQEVMKRQGPR